MVFDPAAVTDRATYEPPQWVVHGVRVGVMDGALVLDGGCVTGARPGRALKGPGCRSRR